ncbi:MAG: glycoside hydrolase family 31 protein, partial [Chthoniobacterales bacterium]
TAGTYTLGAKLRASVNYTFVSGPLKIVGQTANYLGFGTFNGGSANQNLIVDSIQVAFNGSIGAGTNPVTARADLTALTPNTTYHYRAVAQNSSGTTFGPDQTFGFPLTPAVDAANHSFLSSSGDFQARIYDDTGHLAIAGPDLAGNPLANVITFAPPSAKIGGAIYDFGRVISATAIPNGLEVVQSLAATTITAQLTFTSDGVMRYEVTNWNSLTPTETNISAASDSSEHFYGFGEKFNTLDQAGNRVRMITLDPPGTKGDQSYKPMPWFVSTRGYGFHLDSTAESYFDMRKTAADRYTVQNLFTSLKFNVVFGPKLTDVITRFTAYSGRPYLLPKWAFGTWISSDIWRNGGEVRYCVSKHLLSGIPASVFVFDSPWETSYNDFTWNMSQWSAGGTYEGQFYAGFTTVNEMMTYFRSNGLKVICWLTPFVNVSSFQDSVGGVNVPGQNTGQAANYAAGATNNYFVRSSPGGPPLVVPWWKGSGSPVDFTNPAAKSWFLGQLQTLVNDSKVTTMSGMEPAIGGFKTDDGETTNGTNTYIPTTASYFDGRTGVEMRNGFCIEYHKAVSSVLGTDGMLFARSGFTGTQQYPAGWSGDNEANFDKAANGLNSVMVAGQSAAMSGFSMWGHDIGGYQNSNFETDRADLFMRWTQFGAFSPLMQMHRNVDAANLQQYPWGYGAAALANYVAYAKLHTQLFPYIYSYAKEASQTGLPIIRPLVLTNQTDANTYGLRHSFNFGNEFLVAPMNAAASTARNVYLPAGAWYDYWTNTRYTGGQNLAWSNADAAKVPLFVREGAIIPMLINVPQTLNSADYVNNADITTRDNGLQFLVYPRAGSPTSFTVYDGTAALSRVDGGKKTVLVDSVPRVLMIKALSAEPDGVKINGRALAHCATPTILATQSEGWSYEGGFVYAKVQHKGGRAVFSYPSGATSTDDTDADGIPDWWMLEQFGHPTAETSDESRAGDDPDKDSSINSAEYSAGTLARDETSYFRITSLDRQPNTDVTLTWSTVPGRIYQVRATAALDTAYTPISDTITATGDTASYTDVHPTGDNKFYKVVVMP